MKEVVTTDNSHTLYSERYDEHYHSLKDGALSETFFKHILPAFSVHQGRDELAILDICFGLGYNTLASLHHLQKELPGTRVHIYSPELDGALLDSLMDLEYPGEFDTLKGVLETVVKNGYYEDANRSIELFRGDALRFLEQLHTREIKIDIIYQDPFSPKKNSELWSLEYFKKIDALAGESLVGTTYSQARAVRERLASLGYMLYEQRYDGVRSGTVFSKKMLQEGPHLKILKNFAKTIDI